MPYRPPPKGTFEASPPAVRRGKAISTAFSELFVEIGTEEIPSNVMASALQQLSERAAERFTFYSIPFDPPQVYGTPRRLILYLPRLARQQKAKIETIVGPSTKIAFDPRGDPTPAAIGFAKSQGVAVSNLKIRQAGKGEYVSVEKEIPGQPTSLLLKKIIPEIIAAFTFPRSMRWNAKGVSFVRPIRWITAIYNRKGVPFSYAGIKAGGISYGHRIMSPAPFRVVDFASYQREMRRRFVLINPRERYDVIQEEMRKLAERKKGRVEEDETLVWRAAFMLEYPKAICGSFDRSFLEIPKEVMITVMKEHQGYFPLYGQYGELLPYFITIINVETKNMLTIRKGNERVLRARLVDAKFYFDQDKKSKLIDRLEGLKGVVFQEKLGTLYDKVQRLIPLSQAIEKQISPTPPEALSRAALLCKSDLLTGVVREFPTLQGVMGQIYARLEGEDPQVAAAIEEHYLPRFSGGPLPKSRAGQILAIADKLDTLVGCFGVGLIPSGSEDPYALRRQGLGVIQILLKESSLHPVSLQVAISESVRLYGEQKKFSEGRVVQEVTRFLKQRVASYLQSEGVRYDLIDAILARELDHPHVMVKCARALLRFSDQPLFGSLITSFKRTVRILPKGFEGRTSIPLFKDPAEKELYHVLAQADEKMRQDWEEQRYEGILLALATLYEPLNQFFNEVLVMDPNEAIRNNRLGLLVWVRKLFDEFGDFSKIVEGDLASKGHIQ